MSNRYHAMKKVTVTTSILHVEFIKRGADGKWLLPDESDFIASNPQAFIKGFADSKTRVLEWSVVGTKKEAYKVEKEAYESWIRTNGTPCSDEEPDESIEPDRA